MPILEGEINLKKTEWIKAPSNGKPIIFFESIISIYVGAKLNSAKEYIMGKYCVSSKLKSTKEFKFISPSNIGITHFIDKVKSDINDRYK